MGILPGSDITSIITKLVIERVSDPKLQKKVIEEVKRLVIFQDPAPSPLNPTSTLTIIKIIKKVLGTLGK